jgi:hypothetical protein
MEMVAEGVLGVSPNLGHSAVNSTFTVFVEGKPVKEVWSQCCFPLRSNHLSIYFSIFLQTGGQ